MSIDAFFFDHWHIAGIPLATLGTMGEATAVAKQFGIGASTVNYLMDRFTKACVGVLYNEVICLPTQDELERSAARILQERGLVPGCE